MYRWFTRGALVATLALPAAAQTSPTTTLNPPAVTLPAGLDRVLRDYERAWRAGDVDRLVALFTADGVVMQPNRPPARGHAALAAVYRGQGGGPLYLRPFAYAAADTVAYILGAYRYGAQGAEVGKFTLTLHRTRNNRWLIASDMDNSSVAERKP
ncbi:MAG: nuclear transport factor 2 family protein [Gemmatimonadaceae bacterium]|nr:nuclear transport factor 2 family protein [Gemmatimonadaceae bacterium]